MFIETSMDSKDTLTETNVDSKDTLTETSVDSKDTLIEESVDSCSNDVVFLCFICINYQGVCLVWQGNHSDEDNCT
jgi:hypothetical protein